MSKEDLNELIKDMGNDEFIEFIEMLFGNFIKTLAKFVNTTLEKESATPAELDTAAKITESILRFIREKNK